MWELILKALITLIPVVVPYILSLLNYRQNGGRNTTALTDTLVRELEKDKPFGYLVESCVARLHNIRPLPWSFLQIVLPCNHSLEIIQKISFSRRFLDLYDISVSDKRPVVRYTHAFNTPRKRMITKIFFGLLFFFFMTTMVLTETKLLDLIFDNRWQDTVSDEVTTMILVYFVLMVIFGAISCLLYTQLMTLLLSKKRLDRIEMLISASFPDPAPIFRKEPDKDVSA